MNIEIDEIEEIIIANPDLADISVGVRQIILDNAQKYLGVQFPPSYQEFLRRWGTLSFGPNEYYGVTGQDFEKAGIPDAVWFTMLQ